MITTPEMYEAALRELARDVADLGRTVLGEVLPIDTLTLFTHDEKEYETLEKIIRQYGPESYLTHGLTLYIDSKLSIEGQSIRFLGVRRPDESRPQRGYGDFPVKDFDAFCIKNEKRDFIQKIESGRGQPMLELRHPDCDVLGYVVDEASHTQG